MQESNGVNVAQDLACLFCPDLESVLRRKSLITESTWGDRLETGKAIEVVSLCAIVAAFRSGGHDVTFPKSFFDNPDLFYLRNAIPRHHGAQPGHDIAFSGTLDLKTRFISAFIPKAIIDFDKTGRRLFLFREGHPIHQVLAATTGQTPTLDRPDILLVEGELACEEISESILSFNFTSRSGACDGSLRVKNDTNVPLISLSCTGQTSPPVVGIVECSVGKGARAANAQLSRYLHLFGDSQNPVSALVNGQQTRRSDYDIEVFIDITAERISEMAPRLLSCFSSFEEEIRKRIRVD